MNISFLLIIISLININCKLLSEKYSNDIDNIKRVQLDIQTNSVYL